MTQHDPHADARRTIMRRASLYTAAFLGAGVAIAITGAALIAWLLSRLGHPFLRTWLILAVIIVLPGLTAAIWKTIRRR
ncbi:MAG TPA: hypothetical protein VMN60_14885 [Longimicrobiales bacterium]|nr:hypothetical protein [Longimicrobiales bacterium]